MIIYFYSVVIYPIDDLLDMTTFNSNFSSKLLDLKTTKNTTQPNFELRSHSYFRVIQLRLHMNKKCFVKTILLLLQDNTSETSYFTNTMSNFSNLIAHK